MANPEEFQLVTRRWKTSQRRHNASLEHPPRVAIRTTMKGQDRYFATIATRAESDLIRAPILVLTTLIRASLGRMINRVRSGLVRHVNLVASS